jgi:hypothetical protein
VVVLLTIVLVASPAYAARTTTVLGCTVTVDDPHQSTGTPTDVVAKTKVTCSISPQISYVELDMLLFRCPTTSVTNPEAQCTLTASKTEIIELPVAGQKYTRQVVRQNGGTAAYAAVTHFAVCAMSTSGSYERGRVQSATVRVDMGGPGSVLPTVDIGD